MDEDEDDEEELDRQYREYVRQAAAQVEEGETEVVTRVEVGKAQGEAKGKV